MKLKLIQSDSADPGNNLTFFSGLTRFRAAIALTFWTILGAVLRLIHLDSKPPWTDEFATLLYSRGDDYSGIPINEVVTAEALLEPLKGYPVHGVWEAANLLINQDNHPPLYFMGVNLWQRFFPLDEGGYISIYSVRLLSVIFGVLGIFGIYWVAKQVFRSEVTAQLSAALLAMSPFGIYLAQEARHYTLIICWAIASFRFCFYAIQLLMEKRRLSYRFVLGWIVFNCVGLLIHYFFLLTLLGQAIALLWLIRKSDLLVTKSQWLRLGLVGLGMSIFGLVWLTQVLPDSYGSTMTDWIRFDYQDWSDWISPVFQWAIALITMVILLPLQVPFIPTILVAGSLMIVMSIRLIKLWWRGINLQTKHLDMQPNIFFLSRFVVAIGGLFALVTYGFGIDITRGARYSFVYFSAVVLLLAAGLSPFWQQENVNFFGIQKLFKIFPKSGSQRSPSSLLSAFAAV
ncbi:MAG: glycosyltransferase [Limnothrix sp. RL_2_0]|nr:glycosyltransferase [Limnothrix sp. RL_2_0]